MHLDVYAYFLCSLFRACLYNATLPLVTMHILLYMYGLPHRRNIDSQPLRHEVHG